MATTQTTTPFLEEMRQKWQDGELSADEVLAQVLDWEALSHLRSDTELDEAYEFRQEVEGTAGLKSASELQALLDSGAEHHIEDVMDALRLIARAGRLTDKYVGVVRAVLREGGPRYRREVGQMLGSVTGLGPNMQAILNDISSGAAPPDAVEEEEEEEAAFEVPQPEMEDEDEDEDTDAVAQAAQSATAGAGPSQGAQGKKRPKGGQGSQDPWLVTQRFINLGRWDDARQAVLQIPPDHPRADEVANVLAAIDEGEVYDQVPGLRDMPLQLASSDSRRDWDEFRRRQAQAEKLIAEASAASGRSIPMPKSLRDIFNVAIKSQDAEALFDKAVQQRERGDYPGAATSLLDAASLDPRYARVQTEQQLTKDLQDLLFTLRRSPLNTALELADALAMCEELLASHASPGSVEVSTRRDTILAKIEKLIESTRRRIEGRQKAIKEPGNLDDKLAVCDAIQKHLDELEVLRKDDPDLQDLQDWLFATRHKLTDLIAERTAIGHYVSNLKADEYIDGSAVESWLRRLDALASEPLAEGDSATRSIAQELVNKLATKLDNVLQPGGSIDPATLHNAAELLRLAQSGVLKLAPQQAVGYSRSLWVGGAAVVRTLLPKALPPYAGAQSPRSDEIKGKWDQALRVLDWLRNLPSANAEYQTIEALERDFALSVDQVLRSAATLPPRVTRDEQQERIATARGIKEYIPTLPESIRAKIHPQVVTAKRTAAESTIRRRNAFKVLVPIFLVAALLSTAGVVWGTVVGPGIASGQATATAQTRQTNTAVAAASTSTSKTAVAVATASKIAEINSDEWMNPYLEPEANANNRDCTFVPTAGDMGFNICDYGGVHFKEYYSRSGWANFLGAPISKMFPDPQVQHKYVQYFERGRLEQSTYNNTPKAEFGRLGWFILLELPELSGLKAEDAPDAISPDWGSVEGFNPSIRTTHGFLDLYNTGLGAKGTWNPVDFFGGPLTREYQVGDKQVFRQFFERAIFEWREGGQAEALPVGKIYLKLVRNRNVDLPDEYHTGMGDH